MAEKAIPTRLNSVLILLIGGIMLAQLLVLPLLLSDQPWVMALTVLVLIPLNTPLWSLIHEAIHNNALPGRGRNEAAGRALSILFGASFSILRFGHLMHHQYNRDWESEFYEAGSRPKWMEYASHYYTMLGGLYLSEVAGSFAVALLPKKLAEKATTLIFDEEPHVAAAQRSLLKDKAVRQTRIDCALIVLLYGVAFALYGAAFWVLLLLIFGRGLAVSILDNAYHYGTAPDNSVPGKELKVSPWLSKFMLHFNFHDTHHRHAGLPWTQLKTAHEAEKMPYTQSLSSAIFEQFKGPIAKG